MIEGRRLTSLVRTCRRRRRGGTDVSAADTPGIYVVAGNAPACGAHLIDDVARYTASDDVWSARARLGCPERQGHGAVTLGWNGTETALHVVGGNIGGGNYLSNCDRYVADFWTARANLPPPARYRAGCFAWQGRYGMYAGGEKDNMDPDPPRDVDRYDPAGDAWLSYGYLLFPRAEPATFSLRGIGYLQGGWERDNNLQPAFTLWAFNGSWVSKTTLPVARGEHAGFSIGEYGYVVGGVFGQSFHPAFDLYRYNRVGDAWTAMASAPAGRRQHTAAGLGDAGYMQGGKDSDGVTPIGCYGFDETRGWFETAPMPSPTRYWAAAASM